MRPRFARLAAVLLVLGVLAACATGARLTAGGDVHSLLVAIRDDDRATFDAHVDRAALTDEMQQIILDQAKASFGDVGLGVGVLTSGPLSRAAAKVVLRPDVFRAIAESFGYRADQPIPGRLSLAAALTPLPDGRVCARDVKSGACLLTFTNEAGAWKLTSFDARRAGLAPAARKLR